MSKVAAAFDRLFAEKNGCLKESDYNRLSARFLNAVQPIRTVSIRKDLMFDPLPYDEYMESCGEFQERFDEGIPLDLNSVQLLFRSRFGISLFPNLEEELYEPSTFMWRNELRQMATPDGQRIVDASMHSSLPVANHELDVEIKNTLAGNGLTKELSEDVELAFVYSIPARVESEIQVQLDMAASFLL